MDGAAVTALAERFRAPMTIDDRIALPQGWSLVPESLATKLDVYSLGALRDYIKANRDALPLALLVVHVVSPQIVRLHGALTTPLRARETFVEAKADSLADGFVGKFMTVEDFIIGLQARFVDLGARADVLKIVGNLRHETAATVDDDGITQKVGVSAGVVLKREASVPNPVTLHPWRTFREVEVQPGSPFVLRVQGSHGGFQVGLFEADGGAWRLVAVDKVRDWLTREIGPDVAVLA